MTDPPDAEEVIEGHDLEIESLQGEVISSPTRNRRRSRDNGVTLSSVEAAEKAATVGLAALAASNLARQRGGGSGAPETVRHLYCHAVPAPVSAARRQHEEEAVGGEQKHAGGFASEGCLVQCFASEGPSFVIIS